MSTIKCRNHNMSWCESLAATWQTRRKYPTKNYSYFKTKIFIDFIRRLDCNGFSYDKKFPSVHRSVWICKIFDRVSFRYLYLIPFKLSNTKVETSRFRTSTRLVELWFSVAAVSLRIEWKNRVHSAKFSVNRSR